MAALRSPRRLKTEVLAGLVVALALIPEAISFSIIAGVDPRVGLFASFTMAVTIAFTGGRPAMISAATGSVALVIAPLVREHGLDYLIVAVLLGGILQVVLAALGVARLMRFVPRSVMVGFVNALAILIFLSQLPYLIGVPALVYPFVGVGLLIMVLLPRWITAIPAPLIASVCHVHGTCGTTSIGRLVGSSPSSPTLGMCTENTSTAAVSTTIAISGAGIAVIHLGSSTMISRPTPTNGYTSAGTPMR